MAHPAPGQFSVALSRMAAAATLFLFLLVAGCAGRQSADLRLESLASDEPVVVAAEYQTVWHRYRDRNTVTIIASDLPADQLLAGDFGSGQVICIDMFWNPKPGATPIDERATNCSIRQVLFAEDQVGLYGGAGFLLPRSSVDGGAFRADLSDSTLRLLESSDRFMDRLGVARLAGEFVSRRADDEVSEFAVVLNSEVSRRLGRISFVVTD